MEKFAVKGTFMDTPSVGELRTITGYAVINEDGTLESIGADDPGLSTTYDFSGKLIMPGFSDLHLHAPQYSYCGVAMDVQLIEWLSKYTYPEESRYESVEYAKENYKFFVNDLLHSATTRSAIFASLHTDATLELMRQLHETGQAAYVGKLNMNRNCPDFYSELTTENGMKETIRWIDECEKLGYDNIKPIITPRFTPSVTDDYMEALGKLAEKRGIAMQSHLSENPDEIEWVKALCPDTTYYYETYSRYGLFGGNCPTIMAHCIYSGEEEMQVMKDNGVFIAHCPTSNENVIAGIAPAAHYLRNGFKVGIGSDVAGGHTLDLFAVMAAAIQVSKIRWKYVDNSDAPLTAIDALYMATKGGGEFFGKVGLFDKGYEFDAIVIDDSFLKNNREFSLAERLERFIYLGKGEVSAKFVGGKKIL